MSPYRDELESLRAEVERLRRELATRRVANGKIAALLVLLELVAVVVLRPWLNGSSDAKFWGGLAIIVGIAIAAAWSAYGIRTS